MVHSSSQVIERTRSTKVSTNSGVLRSGYLEIRKTIKSCLAPIRLKLLMHLCQQLMTIQSRRPTGLSGGLKLLISLHQNECFCCFTSNLFLPKLSPQWSYATASPIFSLLLFWSGPVLPQQQLFKLLGFFKISQDCALGKFRSRFLLGRNSYFFFKLNFHEPLLLPCIHPLAYNTQCSLHTAELVLVNNIHNSSCGWAEGHILRLVQCSCLIEKRCLSI